jgi:iron(III) transport system permease protein
MANVTAVFASTRFLESAKGSLMLAALSALLSCVAGTALAWAVIRLRLSFSRLLENLIVVPLFMAPLVCSLAWIALAAPNVGFVAVLSNGIINLPLYSIGGMAWVLGTSFAGYVYLSMRGPLRSLSPELEEAALMLGSGQLRLYRTVLLPLLAPQLIANFVLVFTLAIDNFAVPTLLGRHGFRSIPSDLYSYVREYPSDPNLAAALALALSLVTMCGIFIYRRSIRLGHRYVTIGGKPNDGSAVPLSPLVRMLGIGFVFAWVLCTAVLPLAAVVFSSFMRFSSSTLTADIFTLDNYRSVFSGPGARAVINTVVLSAAAATICAGLGGLIAYATTRTRSMGRGALDYFTATTIAVPGISLGLGLLWAVLYSVPMLYNTLLVLLIAYVVRFVGHGVRSANNSLIQMSPSLEEAAVVMGASRMHRLRTIIFPVMLHGLVSGWLMVFIFTTVEVSATIMLYAADTQTMAVLSYNALNLSGTTTAFAFASAQAALVLIVMAIVSRRFGFSESIGAKEEIG